jgi:uncharacterized protein
VSVNTTYPGVYVIELPSSVRTIIGVATSITAFIGRAARGPTDSDAASPVMVSSFADYERTFGGLWKKSEMSYAVYHYFLNGGKTALIIRVHNGANTATFSSGGNKLFDAANPGTWAENLEVVVDTNTDPTNTDPKIFNLTVTDQTTGAMEKFNNISADPAMPRYVAKVLQSESQLVRAHAGFPNSQPTAGAYTCDQAGTDIDGSAITDTEVQGVQASKTGYWALEKADIFNLICVPPFDYEAGTVPSPATLNDIEQYCEQRYAVLLVDPPGVQGGPAAPSGWSSVADVTGSTMGVDSNNFGGTGARLTRKDHAAIFFPRLLIPDPLDENRNRDFAPCGVVAGIIARTDATRGVWKSPAGIDAVLTGVTDLTTSLSDSDSGTLNPLGVNCFRVFPVIGPVVWGSRTLRGADNFSDQWKYLAVRRTALYIEQSLYRGTQWVVFEPNDEPLWSQIRLNVGAFMQSLFLQGAFQGSTPKEAYFVKCDSETTTHDDQNSGRVNILVGFAPLKPAEFVVLKIQQIAQTAGGT